MSARGIVVALVVLFRAVTAMAVTIDELPAESVYTLSRIRIEGTEKVSAAGVRAVMQTRLPRTTRQIASSPHRAPDPQADTATTIGAELGLDAEEAPVDAAAAPPSAPPIQI
jgi:hypothetical protein